MNQALHHVIEQLYMKSQYKCFTINPNIHYTAIPIENGAYVAILREDRHVEDDFVEGLILSVDETGHYDVSNNN